MDLNNFPVDESLQRQVGIALDPFVQAGLAAHPSDINRALAYAKQLKTMGDRTDEQIESALSISATLFETTARNLLAKAKASIMGNSAPLIKIAIAANAEARAYDAQLLECRNRRKKRANARTARSKSSAAKKQNDKVQGILRAI